ncbi:hypothetical protein MJO29_011237 [Puccinia striiformis f. sp. tritici]|nr:hypothetical protein MJO29_011237 [Puccinia striiformis f. sp. tritici]
MYEYYTVSEKTRTDPGPVARVCLCFATGQATHVLDKPVEVISTWSLGDDPTDGLQLARDEDIFNWLNMDALDNLIRWHDTGALQVPSYQAHHSGQEREFGLEGPVDFSRGQELFLSRVLSIMKDMMFISQVQHIPIILTTTKIKHSLKNSCLIYKQEIVAS